MNNMKNPQNSKYRNLYADIYSQLETHCFYLNWGQDSTKSGGTIYLDMSDEEIEQYGLTDWPRSIRSDFVGEPEFLVFHLWDSSDRLTLEHLLGKSDKAVQKAYFAMQKAEEAQREYQEREEADVVEAYFAEHHANGF